MQDFIGFTYNGKHCINDFNIYRTSNGSRYDDNIVPSFTDKTADVPGGDGQFYFYTHHKNKQFSVSIAFDHLTEEKYREMRNWLDGREIHDLIFDEAPYKIYSAKVTGTPQLKTLCFDEYNEELEMNQRVYKGEGTIQFTCYHPYARTPEIEPHGFDGRTINNYYERYRNVKEWEVTSNITTHKDGMNPGDVPAPFVVTTSKGIAILKNATLVVGDLKVTLLQDKCYNLNWDSKSGLITGALEINNDDKSSKETIVIHYSGTSYGTIPVDGINFRSIYLLNEEKETNGQGQEDTVYYKYYLDNKRQKSDENGNNVDKKIDSFNNESFGNKSPFTIKYNYWYY